MRALALVVGVIVAIGGLLLSVYGGSLVVVHLVEGSYETPRWIIGAPILLSGIVALVIGVRLLAGSRERS